MDGHLGLIQLKFCLGSDSISGQLEWASQWKKKKNPTSSYMSHRKKWYVLFMQMIEVLSFLFYESLREISIVLRFLAQGPAYQWTIPVALDLIYSLEEVLIHLRNLRETSFLE